jgi:probable F420-dependent oxidoreductase
MSPFFNPGPIDNPKIPIYIAGVNAGLARLAGEVCDGFVVHPLHSPRYLQQVILPAIQGGAAKPGRSAADVTLSVTAIAATTPHERDFARSQVAFYASTPSYRSVMDLHGWGGAAHQLSAHAARGEWDSMAALVTDEMLAEFCLVTDADSAADALKRRYHGIADRLTLYTPFIPGERDVFWRHLIG